jgi:hemolysin activation/secretion protein
LWDHSDALDVSDETLASVGVGVRWRMPNGLSAQLYWGQPLENVGSESGDLQDDGVYFAIELSGP